MCVETFFFLKIIILMLFFPIPLQPFLLIITLGLFVHGAGWVLEDWQHLPGPRHSQGPRGCCAVFIS